ncbi:MAG: flagellar basal body rod protein FlgB [Humidesulfovibrio sp.]|nr:flagellar basal body rod protein FlgB [Humidesulfovibrio sp.]
MRGLFEEHLNVVAKVLDLRLQRQNVVMANIANISTPNYKARSLAFEDELQDAMNQDGKGQMARTDPRHLPTTFDVDGFQGKGATEFKPRMIYGNDSVDLDKEMSTMAKNTLMYNALSDIEAKDFAGLQTVIQEGGK